MYRRWCSRPRTACRGSTAHVVSSSGCAGGDGLPVWSAAAHCLTSCCAAPPSPSALGTDAGDTSASAMMPVVTWQSKSAGRSKHSGECFNRAREHTRRCAEWADVSAGRYSLALDPDGAAWRTKCFSIPHYRTYAEFPGLCGRPANVTSRKVSRRLFATHLLLAVAAARQKLNFQIFGSVTSDHRNHPRQYFNPSSPAHTSPSHLLRKAGCTGAAIVPTHGSRGASLRGRAFNGAAGKYHSRLTPLVPQSSVGRRPVAWLCCAVLCCAVPL